MDQETTDIIIVFIALFGSIGLAAFLLTRARNRVKEEAPQATPVAKIPASASRRQRRILEKLEPDPELPTLMDLVREEVAELGIDEIPGHEDISPPVLLKVYKRDFRDDCPHGEWEYTVTAGLRRDEAEEPDVKLVCKKCGESGTNSDVTTFTE
jgi:hypothetical protein